MLGRLPWTRRIGLEQLEKREMLSGTTAAYQAGRPSAATDDYANTFAQAAAISLSTAGSANQSGKIEKSGDVDVFQFVATTTGKMTLRELAASGSRLDAYLYVYDGNQTLLAKNDDYGRSLNSQVTINVTAGQTYYVKAAAYGRSAGAYSVQIATTATTTTPTTDDFGNTIAQAAQVTLSTAGSASQSGTIETSGDVDMFKVVATVTGTMTIRQAASSGSSLNSYLYVYDSTGQLLGQSGNNGVSSSCQVQISVVAGTTYYLKAAGYQTSTGAYALSVTTAAATTTPTESGFQITATVTGMTTAEQAIIQQAIDRWESIIVGDLTDVTYRGRVIDDVEIAISGITIDGSGSILGQSTATAYRSGSYLPYMGYIQLDTADVATMLSDGSLLDVVVHEIGHVLGFGVIWSNLGLLVGANTSSPGFTGANAVAEYNSIFGTSVTAVPVEAHGGSGTALSHWDETVFDTELMTGYYNSGETNSLSRITIASMADLGYTVNMVAADSYTRPTSSVTTSSVTSSVTNGRSGWTYRNVAAVYATQASAESADADTATTAARGAAAYDRVSETASVFLKEDTASSGDGSTQDIPAFGHAQMAGRNAVFSAGVTDHKAMAALAGVLNGQGTTASNRLNAVDSWFDELSVSGGELGLLEV